MNKADREKAPQKMLDETIAKLKSFADEKLQKVKSYKLSQNFTEILRGKRNTLKITLSERTSQNKIHWSIFHIFRRKDSHVESKSSAASEETPKVVSFASKNNFSRKKTLKYAVVFGITAFLVYEFAPHRTKIILSFKNTPENNALASRLTYLHNQHFYPTVYSFAPLLQSIVNQFMEVNDVTFEREYLKLQDGGTIALDWANPYVKVEDTSKGSKGKYAEVAADENTPTIFVIHGLTGGSNAGYIRGFVKHAQKRGFRVVVFQHRGVNQPLSTPLPYNGGVLDDLSFAIDHVRAKLPKARLMAVGNSLGGNQLLRYLGQTGENCPFESAVALSCPWDVNKCVNALTGTVYEKFFIKKFAENSLLPHMGILVELSKSHGIDLDQVMSSKSLRMFHDNFTIKVYNYKDSYELFDTYLVKKEQIQNIKIPTLILHSRDDPIVVAKDIPKEDIAENDNIILAETTRGAHICWFTGLKPKRVII